MIRVTSVLDLAAKRAQFLSLVFLLFASIICSLYLRIYTYMLHCTAGIKVLEAIDITDKNEVFAGNMLAFVTVHQHAGLAFLMLKRYKDAARILNEVGGGGGGRGGSAGGVRLYVFGWCWS